MKISRQHYIKKYTRAFFKAYGELLQPSDIHTLQAFTHFVNHRPVCAQPDQVRPEIMQAIKDLVVLLEDHARLSLLPDIMRVITVRFLRRGYQWATVTTAIPATQTQQQEVIESFKNITGQQVDAVFTVSPDLIAGMRIVSQDYLWESSLAQKIKVILYGY